MIIRNRHFLILDIIFLSLMPLLALVLRQDITAWQAGYPMALLQFTVLALAVKLLIFYLFGIYRRYWRYASIGEMIAIGSAVLTATIAIAGIFFGVRVLGFASGHGLPRSIPFIDGLLTFVVVGGMRFSVRVMGHRRALGERQADLKPVLIAGAGDAGTMIAREMLTSGRVNLEPVGFVDDDPHKQRKSIHGLPVLGMLIDIPPLVEKYDIQEVIIAIPTAAGKVIREIVTLCEAAHVTSRTMPGMYDLLSGQVSVNLLRNVGIEDLLRREPVRINPEDVKEMLSGKRVLVTGAGGSIGSELCRQISRSNPANLTLVGHGENSLFTIENELHRLWPDLRFDAVVADIRDTARLNAVFSRVRPDVVFHAAAHKHVPLMERNIEDAVTNNVEGTRELIRMAEQYDVERFVLISSDKAVNPTNVMGATKRVAEMLVQAAAKRCNRHYVSVRFGNVLGSRGSVVPTFREQIARGGPVTVTHPDVCRYFMTIPEAVQLVLQAAALGESEYQRGVFVLDMGEPIKIVDLARDLIELSGKVIGQDVEIIFTGLRSGEKLFEELFFPDEEHLRTKHEKILVAVSQPGTSIEHEQKHERELNERVDQLLQAAYASQEDKVRSLLKEIVPSYNL